MYELFTFKNMFILGGSLAVVYYVLHILSMGFGLFWHWVDDGETPIKNRFARLLYTPAELKKGWYRWDEVPEEARFSREGHRYRGSYWAYYQVAGDRIVGRSDSKRQAGDDDTNKELFVYAFLPLMVALVPAITLSAYHLWELLAIVGLVYGLAWTTRMARRQQKLFKQHVEDKDAHKE